MGKYIFNDIFREILDTYYIDSTVLGDMIDRDSSRIRHYKIDSKPGKAILDKLIHSICIKIQETNDKYVNTILVEKINNMISNEDFFTDEIRSKLLESNDIQTYISFILRRSLEFSNEGKATELLPDSSSEVRNLIQKISQAHHYFESNLYEEALKLYTELLQHPKLSTLSKQGQLAHTDLGLIYRHNGLSRYDIEYLKQSIAHFKIASGIARKTEDLGNYALINKYLGTVYTSLSNFEAADANLKKAAEYYDTSLSVLSDDNQEEYAKVMINYGKLFESYANIRNSRNFLNNSVTHFKKAIQYYEGTTSYFKALAYLNCSSAYSLLTEISNSQVNAEQALKMVHNALEIFTIEEYPLMYAMCISNLGHIHLMMAPYNNTIENCNKAIHYINQSLNIFSENIDAYSYIIAHLNLTSIYILLYNHSKEYEYLKKAYECIENCRKYNIAQDNSVNNIKVNLNHAEVLITIAEAKNEIYLLEESEAIIRNALEVSSREKYDYLKALAECNLANLHFIKYKITNNVSLLYTVLIHAKSALEVLTIHEYPLNYGLTTHLLAKVHHILLETKLCKQEYESILSIFTKEKYPEKYNVINKEYEELVDNISNKIS